MAGIGSFGGKTDEEKNKFQTDRPAEKGYSYSIGPIPNKVYANNAAAASQVTPVNPTPPTTPARNSGMANKKDSVTLVTGTGAQNWSSPSGGSTVNNSGTAAPTPSAQEKAETSIADLMNRYSSELREDYNYSANKMKEERDAALRENWILQKQAQASIPEQLAAMGINGGARETAIADIIAKYQGNRNDIQNEYLGGLGDLAHEQQSKQSEIAKSYNDRWLDYLMSLAQAEKEHEYDKELARLR